MCAGFSLKKTSTVSLSIDVRITMVSGVVYLLRIFKMFHRLMNNPVLAPTCFGSRRNHHQGTVLCFARTTNMVFLCSSLWTQSMLWRHISLLCRCAIHTAHLHNRLVCRHNIDCVHNDEHRKTISVVLVKHRTAP